MDNPLAFFSTVSTILVGVFVAMALVGIYLIRQDIYAILPTRLKRFVNGSYNETGEFRWRRGQIHDDSSVFHKEIELRNVHTGRTCWKYADDCGIPSTDFSSRVISNDDLEHFHFEYKTLLTPNEMESICRNLRAVR